LHGAARYSKNLRKHLTNQDKVAYFLLGRKLRRSTLEGKMKRVIAFIILYSSFAILCPSTKAQWEGAEVQRLTYDDLPNETIGSYNLDESVGLFIDEADNLHLFYLEGV
jgi:hypothetical protein